MKRLPYPTILIALLCCCSTRPLEVVQEVIYNPPVVFVGYVNDDYDSLPGNLFWPNTCEIHGDTIHMYFWSGDFYEENGIRHGDFMRIFLLPNANDSLIGTRNVYFHMARYLDQNYSYDVVPKDTLFSYSNKVEIRALELSRSRGAPLELDRMAVIAKALIGNTGLVIRGGRIFGRVP